MLILKNKNIAFGSDGEKRSFVSEELEIEFAKSTIDSVKLKATSWLAIIPTLIDIGFRLTTKVLEDRIKEFTAEYTKTKSNIDAATEGIPDFTLKRTLTLEGFKKREVALVIEFKAKEVLDGTGFIYYIPSIKLEYSSARPTEKSSKFDYTIEVKPTIVADHKKTIEELSPIVISSVDFGDNQFPDMKHRTGIIFTTKGALVTEVSVKVIETNPFKVRAEEILSLWNDNKDDFKTIINNYIPKPTGP